MLYAVILIGPALCLPLTFAYVASPSLPLWRGIRLVLASLLALQPRRPSWACWPAVVGSASYSFQTAVVDMLVWLALYPV